MFVIKRGNNEGKQTNLEFFLVDQISTTCDMLPLLFLYNRSISNFRTKKSYPS